MRLNRFIGPYDLSKNTVEILDPKIIKQIKGVLRMKKGDKIILSDGVGREAEATIDYVSINKIVCNIKERNFARTVLAKNRNVNLYLAILKKENFELAVQKAVECGVANITPIITERTIKTGLNIPRLEKIILEASEQSGRNIVPTLSPILKFTDALIDGNKCEEKIIFHLGGENFKPHGGNASVAIFIGPEGGFTSKEINLAKESVYTVASLGALTLRGKTAAIVATYRAVQRI